MTLTPSGGHDGVVIWMHGLGDTAMGWYQALWGLAPRMKIVLPTAETRPITLNGGMSMPGWFDIVGLDSSAPEDAEGMAESSARVRRIMEKEMEEGGLGPEAVIIGGFSQGGAVALHTALRADVKLGGCVAASTWLPLREEYPGALGSAAQDLRVLFCHGTEDPVVRPSWGRGSHDFLIENLGIANVSWREYEGMPHSACEDELEDIRTFLLAGAKAESDSKGK